MRGDHIKATPDHDAGAYARCAGCGRYSDNPSALKPAYPCACGKDGWWTGSFKPPGPDVVWNEEEDTDGK